jgi:hypothetical protein
MKHEFTHPARVVELPFAPPEEDDPPTEEQIPPAPAATDDGQPLGRDAAEAA